MPGIARVKTITLRLDNNNDYYLLLGSVGAYCKAVAKNLFHYDYSLLTHNASKQDAVPMGQTQLINSCVYTIAVPLWLLLSQDMHLGGYTASYNSAKLLITLFSLACTFSCLDTLTLNVLNELLSSIIQLKVLYYIINIKIQLKRIEGNAKNLIIFIYGTLSHYLLGESNFKVFYSIM